MMQHRGFTGKRMRYRPMIEAEMSEAERGRVYRYADKARCLQMAQEGLVLAARKDQPGFDEHGRWVVAACKTGMELDVAEELKAKGIMVWCPVSKGRTPPKRGRKAMVVERAVFRGYVFLRLMPTAEAWVGALSASRLIGFMGSGGTPIAVPERMMKILRLQVQDPDIANLPALATKGQAVDVRSGPFASFQAIVRRVLAKTGKLECEINIFGRMSLVTLDLDDVKI